MRHRAAGSAAALAALALMGAGASGGAGALDELVVYSAGERVDGLPLAAVLRSDGTASHISFVYGDCVAGGDAGCAPPAEIQVWPACRRNLGLYGAGAPPGPAVEPAMIRGVPAAFFDDGTRLELQAGRSTVVVFAGSRARVLRLAQALRAADGSVPPGGALPVPEPSAPAGGGGC
jgi:hypothetical protein